MRRHLSLTLTTVLLATTVLAADSSRRALIDRTLDSIFSVTTFDQVAMSPDGRHVSWVQRLINKDGSPSSNSAIFIRPYGSDVKPQRITVATGGKPAAESDIAWSPDSRRIAFLSNATNSKQSQLYVVTPGSTTPPRRLTQLKGEMKELQWSHDGKEIAFLFIENASRKGGALAAMTPDSGVVDETFEEQRIAVVTVATGAVAQVSPSDMYVYHYDWSPDGRRLAGSAAFGSGENNWWIAQLYNFDRQSAKATSIYRPRLQIGPPRYSPDGKRIAFVEGLMSDEGNTGGDVMVISSDGGRPVNWTEGSKVTATSLHFLSNSELLVAGNSNGASHLMSVSEGSQPHERWTGAEKISSRSGISISLSSDGSRSAIVRESFSAPPEIWSGTLGEWRKVTQANGKIQALWGEARNLSWKSDEFEVQGWLVYPVNFDPSRKYPMIVNVHGGPSSSVTSAWPSSNIAPLAAAGYFVFHPNFRGSYGRGIDFQQANRKDFGGGDLRDILTGVDHVLSVAPIDRERVGIWGWSYGGYMTMWAVTQTNRFRAAVAGAGIANWQSYYGQNDIDQWMIPFFGSSVYDDPKIYAKSSPIEFIKNVKTPTLILVGERDGEVPAPQSYEFWHALKTLGVDTKLVIYPAEGHKIEKPEHRRDIPRRIVEWFDSYMTVSP